MPETSLVLAAATLAVAAVVLVLLMVVAGRLRAAAAAREAAARDTAELRTALEVLKAQGQDLERDLKQDLAIARGEQQSGAQTLRTEVGERLAQFTQATQAQSAALAQAQSEQLRAFAERLAQFTHAMQQQLLAAANAQADQARLQGDAMAELTRALREQLAAASTAQSEQARVTGERIAQLSQASELKLEAVRSTVEQRLDLLRGENAKKLDEMRATVDEKLQATLETRLGESFKLVSDRLEQVHRGLGEMQSLATGVGDLKRVLTNVKTRGGWGEVQLGALLADILRPEQFAQNVATRPGKTERVEFAVRLPGRGEDGAPCWLPIDCKFPLEDWQRLQDAVERADAPAVEASRKALEQFFRMQSKSIRDKYVEPPHTTDFAILFVPTEGLFAEAVSRPGLADALQREYRVSLAGPTTLAAMLNSLQMGFRTLAIEKRSTEVWRVLGAIKSEFGKFGDILAKTQKKLQEASNTIDEARGKSTTIVRKLRDVEALPVAEAGRLLAADAAPLSDAIEEPPLLELGIADEPGDVK
jgi:DNA recombination protein RmuC